MSTRRRKMTPEKRRAVRRAAAASAGWFALAGVLYLVGAVSVATASVATAAGSSAVGYITYRRELAQVKRTGRPIEDTPAQPAPRKQDPAPGPVREPTPAERTDDLEPVVDPEPVDLDPPVKVHHSTGCPLDGRTDEHDHPHAEWRAMLDNEDGVDHPLPRRRTRPEPRERRERPQPGTPVHPGCQAKSRSTCRCPDGPNRGGKGGSGSGSTVIGIKGKNVSGSTVNMRVTQHGQGASRGVGGPVTGIQAKNVRNSRTVRGDGKGRTS